jgi:hypothetical protein
MILRQFTGKRLFHNLKRNNGRPILDETSAFDTEAIKNAVWDDAKAVLEQFQKKESIELDAAKQELNSVLDLLDKLPKKRNLPTKVSYRGFGPGLIELATRMGKSTNVRDLRKELDTNPGFRVGPPSMLLPITDEQFTNSKQWQAPPSQKEFDQLYASKQLNIVEFASMDVSPIADFKPVEAINAKKLVNDWFEDEVVVDEPIHKQPNDVKARTWRRSQRPLQMFPRFEDGDLNLWTVSETKTK